MTESGVYVGKRLLKSDSESVISNFIIRAHNSEIPEQTTSPFSTPYVSMEKTGVEEEWISYAKHFFWKHHKKLIPRHDKIVKQVPEGPIAFIQEIVNAKRKEHFVGISDSMTVRGVDALRAAKEFHTSGEGRSYWKTTPGNSG